MPALKIQLEAQWLELDKLFVYVPGHVQLQRYKDFHDSICHH